MQKQFIIKPANAAIKVRDPVTLRHLSIEGEAVPRTTHWLRALKRGDVVEVVARKTNKTTAATPATHKKGGN